jgi:protein gp37
VRVVVVTARYPLPSGKCGIAWTDITVALGLYGCTRVSPACAGCWAEQMAARLAHMGHGDYARASRDGRWSGLVSHHEIEHVLPLVAAVPRARSGHRYVFPWSMTDFLHESVPVEWSAAVIRAMGQRPDVTWQLLTKRANRYPDLARAVGAWPANVWAGATVEDGRRAEERIGPLLDVPAAVRWLSVEPMLDWIPLPRDGISWVVAGGESGTGARPWPLVHVYELRDRCASVGTAFFLKQGWGFKPRKDLADVPADLRVREMPRLVAA